MKSGGVAESKRFMGGRAPYGESVRKYVLFIADQSLPDDKGERSWLRFGGGIAAFIFENSTEGSRI